MRDNGGVVTFWPLDDFLLFADLIGRLGEKPIFLFVVFDSICSKWKEESSLPLNILSGRMFSIIWVSFTQSALLFVLEVTCVFKIFIILKK